MNINNSTFTATAEVGTIRLLGKSELLQANAEVGTVIADDLEVNIADVDIDGWGKVSVGKAKTISGMVRHGGNLVYQDSATNVKAGSDDESTVVLAGSTSTVETKTRYIKLKVKNNSWKRLNAYVIGPKPDGKKFSYGFPMRPGQVRDKNWTIGTKVYRKTALGVRKLLIEIKAEDEGQVVNLH